MSLFTLEIVRSGETPAVVDVVTLPDGRVSWRQVEALALLIEDPDETFIRVKNDEGKTVIHAGVRTTLASIHQCPCTSCPLKKALAKRSLAQGGPVSQLRSGLLLFDDTAVYPCEMRSEPQDCAALSQAFNGGGAGKENI
jgi:hypothetical protein